MSFFRKVYTSFVSLWRKATGKKPIQLMLSGQLRPTGRLVAHKLPSQDRPPASLEVNVSDNVSVGERVVGHGHGELREALRVADSEGQSSAADLFAGGTVTFAIPGRSRQGEEGNDKVCKILIERLNQDGARWSELRDVSRNRALQKEKVDFEAYDSKEVLKIQVTRAEHKQHIWKTLNQCKSVATKYSTVDDAADALRDAVKAKEMNIEDKSQRAELLLALDATETGSHVFG